MGTRPIPLAWGRGPIVDKDGNPTPMYTRWMSDHETMVRSVLQITSSTPGGPTTPTGQIQAAAQVVTGAGPLGTVLQNLDNNGVVKAPGVDFTRAYLNKTTDNITDGTGNPLAGGKRGFQALDANNRLANSFRTTGVNVSSTPTSATTLSNTGAVTNIVIASSTNQFAPGTVNYNSGSFDPGSYGGPNYIFFADPTFAGGAVVYQQSTTPQQETSAEGNVISGSITTVNGTSKTGGGNTGGTGGGRGGRGFLQ